VGGVKPFPVDGVDGRKSKNRNENENLHARAQNREGPAKSADRPNEAYTSSRRITLGALGVTLKEPAVNPASALDSKS
jgi:hypothetical protein